MLVNHPGGYTTKVNSIHNLSHFTQALAMISLVHWRATHKYPPYSWYQDPNNRDSSLSDNINAILRHFGAHSMENYIDIEGLPHIFHMCCRAGMLITTFYRGGKGTENSLPLGLLRKMEYDTTNNPMFGMYITAEEILSINKMDIYGDEILESNRYISNDLGEMHTQLQGILLNLTNSAFVAELSANVNEGKYTTINEFDRLFTTILSYAQIFWNKYKLQDLLDKKSFNDEEIKYLNTYLIQGKW